MHWIIKLLNFWIIEFPGPGLAAGPPSRRSCAAARPGPGSSIIQKFNNLKIQRMLTLNYWIIEFLNFRSWAAGRGSSQAWAGNSSSGLRGESAVRPGSGNSIIQKFNNSTYFDIELLNFWIFQFQVLGCKRGESAKPEPGNSSSVLREVGASS